MPLRGKRETDQCYEKAAVYDGACQRLRVKNPIASDSPDPNVIGWLGLRHPVGA